MTGNSRRNRAGRFGLFGAPADAFLALDKAEQVNVLAAMWRMGGMQPHEAHEAARLDMTPIEYELHRCQMTEQ